jgi:hypothetical protein
MKRGLKSPGPTPRFISGVAPEQREAREVGKPSKRAETAERHEVGIRHSDEGLPPSN